MLSLKIHGSHKCKSFLDWIYSNATVKLNRKYAIYKELKQQEINKLK